MTGTADLRLSLPTLIPREPHRVSTTELVRLLAAQGIRRTARAVQKACAALERDQPDLRCIDTSKPFQWSWRKDAPTREFPPMNAHAALTLKLAFEYARYWLPPATLEHLRHQQRRADEVLESAGLLRAWRRKLRVLPRGIEPVPPAIDEATLRAVYEGLLTEERILVTYRRWRAASDERYEVSPLALVVRGSILTLVARVEGKPEPRHLHLHRMRSAEVVSGRRADVQGFDLDAHIRDGRPGFLLGDPKLALRLRVHSDALPTVLEQPLAPDQRLSVDDDGHGVLEATVADTLDLRGWLKSYGPKLEVLGPSALREAVARELDEAARMYRVAPRAPRRAPRK